MPYYNTPLEDTITDRIQLPVIQNTWQELSFNALGYLLEEYDNGFVNTKHVMPFPKEQFRTEQDLQEGDVFQRALILDTLLDLNSIMHNQLNEAINQEVKYLINMRRKNGVGGWAYFPGLPELPPDADDLAQVMQAVLRAGYAATGAPLFETPLNILLNDQVNGNGWESWIIPKSNPTEEQQLQNHWVHTAWGTGSDTEVVANLIYALILFDAARFTDTINRGITFLTNSHESLYRWKSTWYYGNYYGTYVALRALCAANGPTEVIVEAIAFLENSRLPDGSWETEGHGGSALQTALALLSLSIAKKHLGLTLNNEWLESSLNYLKQTHNTVTGWPSAPFIQMPMGRPYGFVHTTLTYESAAITNNYIAKACHHISNNHIL